MKKITSKEDVKFFRREIKKELKRILSNEENGLGDTVAFELLNDDDNYICHIFVKPDLNRITFDSISVHHFMFYNDYVLNKYTSDYKLNKVVNRIIEDYNYQVDREIEYRKASEEIEAEWRKKYGME